MAAHPVAAHSHERAFAQPAAVLTVIAGDVLLRNTAPEFTPAADGTVLFVGDTVRTSADARAVLTLFEGSTVVLEPGSEIMIAEAVARRDGATVIDLVQYAGRSWHVVTHLVTADSRYEVRTPSATASVRGTTFEVLVVDDPIAGAVTTVTTTEGSVATFDSFATNEVLVAADHTTTVRANSAPDSPRRAPEAERVVTVTTSSASSLVVDPLGRTNGMKEGRVVAQTPGARVRTVNGTVVVTLPDLPEGPITTTVPFDTSPVTVSTTVSDRGKQAASVQSEVRSTSGGTTGVDVRSGTSGEVKIRALTREETEEHPGAKLRSRKSSNSTVDATPERAAPSSRRTAVKRPSRTERR